MHKMTMTKEEVIVNMTFLDKDNREIITKAVCGKGRKLTKETHSITPSHNPSSILGCWIINHLYNAKNKQGDTVEINGSYDINIWYSYNDNTKTEVVTERVTYCDEVSLTIRDHYSINDDYEVIAKVIQQPNCLECTISKSGDKINVDVEREFIAKVIGETKLYVRVNPTEHHRNEEDDWNYETKSSEQKDLKPKILGNHQEN